MHSLPGIQIFGLGVFLGGLLVLTVKTSRARAQNRCAVAQAARLVFRRGRVGVASVLAVLLGGILLALPASNTAPPAAAATTFWPPQAATGAVEAQLDQPQLTMVSADELKSGAPAVSLNPSMSTDALQRAIARAPRGANVVFAAGTYNVTNTITLPCNDLHLAGPEGIPPAAILSASFKNSSIFAYTTGCQDLGSINYLHFENTGAVYVGGGDNGNFRFEHNLVTNLPSGLSNGGSEAGLFFDGSLNTSLRNVTIRDNTFGDDQSCTAVFATPKDEGGYCSGIITSQGENNHIRIEYNNFFHLENGVHFNQMAQWAPGKPNSVCIACVVDYNYIAHYHRIGIEIQVSTPADSIRVEHNAVVDPIKSSWGTFAVSMACCQWGRNFATLGFAPGFVFNDNVLVATLPIGSECPPYGVEFWGHGSLGVNSLIQGTFCNGYTWGFGAGSWSIDHNYICGPSFVAKGGYISDQQKQGNPPKQTDNLIAATCSATPSTAPVITPSSGSLTGSQRVTLTDKGLNTGIWYTTDGSTPVPGAGTAHYYTAPFMVTGTTTVKAVGMWGAPNQPLTYPAGYGYVPSQVITASYTVSSNTLSSQPRAQGQGERRNEAAVFSTTKRLKENIPAQRTSSSGVRKVSYIS